MDIALAGQIATIECLEQDYEGKCHVCVVLDNDPGRDMGLLRQPGHRFFSQCLRVSFSICSASSTWTDLHRPLQHPRLLASALCGWVDQPSRCARHLRSLSVPPGQGGSRSDGAHARVPLVHGHRLGRGPVHDIVAETLLQIIEPVVHREAVTLIAEHHAAGRDVVVVSTSSQREPIAAMLEADMVIATRMTVRNGRYTGDIDFYAYRENKAAAIRRLAAERGYDLAECYAYTDSATDVPMLEAVGPLSRSIPTAPWRREAADGAGPCSFQPSGAVAPAPRHHLTCTSTFRTPGQTRSRPPSRGAERPCSPGSSSGRPPRRAPEPPRRGWS